MKLSLRNHFWKLLIQRAIIKFAGKWSSLEQKYFSNMFFMITSLTAYQFTGKQSSLIASPNSVSSFPRFWYIECHVFTYS